MAYHSDQSSCDTVVTESSRPGFNVNVQRVPSQTPLTQAPSVLLLRDVAFRGWVALALAENVG